MDGAPLSGASRLDEGLCVGAPSRSHPVPPTRRAIMAERRSAHRASRRYGALLTVVATYLAVAVWAYWDAWSRGAGQYATGAGGDVAQSMWFLTWPPYAVLHGLNPLFSAYGNYPFGVNLLVNTSSVGVALLVAPVTLLFGPVSAFNVAMTLAMALSACAAYALARRFTSWRPAAFAAGLLYGFSPYMAAEGLGHLMAVFVPLPPIILLLLHDVVVRQPGRPVLRGVLLGLALVAQFFVSIEVLSDVLLLAAAGVVVAAVMARRTVPSQVRYATRALGATVATCAVLLVYPLWLFFAGPGHIVGAIHFDNQLYSADLLGPIVPDSLQRVAPASLAAIADRFGGNISENGSYLGLPLVAVVVAGAIWLRRSAVVRVAAILCGLAFLLSLGAHLRVGNHVTSLALPATLLEHVPLLNNAIPVRFSLYVVLFASVVLAAVLDRLHAGLARRRRALAVALPTVLAVAVFLPLVPSWPYATVPTAVPTFFSSDAAATIPIGSVVLIYPFPDSEWSNPQLWQAATFMHFKSVGGRFKVPQPGQGTAVGSVASEADTVLRALAWGTPPPKTPSIQRRVVGELASWQVRYVVAVPVPSNAPLAISYLTWLLGAPPVRVAGAYLWDRWRR